MKFIIYLVTGLIISVSLSAQTNTFPSSGNVGIGTTSPFTSLDIYKNISSISSGQHEYTANIALTIGKTTATGDKYLFMGTSQSGYGFIGSVNKGTGYIPLVFNPDGGNVGIGTTSPIEKLEVSGNIRQSGRTTCLFGAASNENQALMFAGWGVAHGGIYWRGDSRTFTINTGNSADDVGNYGNANLAVTGNVLVGTTSLPASDAKLAVDGNIYSRKVKVTQTGWADYVFHASYRLRPLSEVEQYIQQHHHLPEVPSAAEVEKNGLDLGDNQATLLKKIEELTLYIIDQNKKLQEQGNKLERQNQALQNLNDRIKVLENIK